MPLKYAQRLLDHLQHEDYEPGPVSRLAEDLGIPPEQAAEFNAAVRTMADRGDVVIDDRGTVRLPRMPDEIIGTFKKNQRGFGFVVPDKPYREGDLFIPREETLDALTGDRVRVAVERTVRRGERDTIGIVLEVIKRKRKSFTGELVQRGGMWLVFPDGKELTQPIVVPDAGSKNAKAGDKVVVEMTRYPEGNMTGEGVVVRVLGEAGRPDVETQATIAAYDLPSDEFPEEGMATFTCSFGAADRSTYSMWARRTASRFDPAFDFTEGGGTAPGVRLAPQARDISCPCAGASAARGHDLVASTGRSMSRNRCVQAGHLTTGASLDPIESGTAEGLYGPRPGAGCASR